mmetsp:Transcript_19899/g.48381  ORF Transcript_19899/g.48381 Transcript_19899/m.48381 type:complete len:96 (+) Transcript_19899:97-384(+)
MRVAFIVSLIAGVSAGIVRPNLYHSPGVGSLGAQPKKEKKPRSPGLNTAGAQGLSLFQTEAKITKKGKKAFKEEHPKNPTANWKIQKGAFVGELP